MTTPTWISSTAFAGRLLMASVFAPAGYDKLLSAGGTAQYMGSAGLPAWPMLAMLVGLFEIVAAILLLTGLKARWAAIALSGFTIVATLLFHAYWAAPAEQQFIQQLLFAKNIGLVGGLLLVAAFGPGSWSLDVVWPRAGTRSGPRTSAP